MLDKSHKSFVGGLGFGKIQQYIENFYETRDTTEARAVQKEIEERTEKKKTEINRTL